MRGVAVALLLLTLAVAAFVYYQFISEEHPLQFLNEKVEDALITEGENVSITFIADVQIIKLNWGKGNFQEALTGAQELLAKSTTNEENAIAHYWIGLSYYRLGQIDNAEKEELIAVQLDPNFGAPYVTLAAISLSKNECNNALVKAQKSVELSPDYAWSYNVLGLSQICLGNREEGITNIKKAIELEPENYVFQSNLQRIQEASN